MNEYTLKSPFEVWWTTAEEFTENIPAISTIGYLVDIISVPLKSGPVKY